MNNNGNYSAEPGGAQGAEQRKGCSEELIDWAKNVRVQPYTSFAVASFVLGIVAVVFIWTEGVSYIPAIIGLILAVVARKKGNTGGFATAGLWLNIIPIIGTTVLLILSLAGIALCATAL